MDGNNIVSINGIPQKYIRSYTSDSGKDYIAFKSVFTLQRSGVVISPKEDIEIEGTGRSVSILMDEDKEYLVSFGDMSEYMYPSDINKEREAALLEYMKTVSSVRGDENMINVSSGSSLLDEGPEV